MGKDNKTILARRVALTPMDWSRCFLEIFFAVFPLWSGVSELDGGRSGESCEGPEAVRVQSIASKPCSARGVFNFRVGGTGVYAAGGAAPVAVHNCNCTDDGIKLYRGVTVDHPHFDDALKGIVKPRGGPATITEHVAGNTRSNFTSWTDAQDLALKFTAGDGVVHSIVVRPGNTQFIEVVSPLNQYGMREWLAKGVVRGASVTRYRGWYGW